MVASRIPFYWVLLLESIRRFPALVSRVLWKPVIWILLKFSWLVATWWGICVLGVGFSEQITNSYIYLIYIYILYIYKILHGIRHWRIIWSSYRKLAWVGIEPMTTEFHSDTLTDWAIRPWVQFALRANFVQLLQFHHLFLYKYIYT